MESLGGFNGVPLAIGGIEDHVHLLIGLRATHRLDYVLRDIKGDSSSWVHNVIEKKQFEWQSGYLGITVSPSQIDRVKRYVLNSGEAPSSKIVSGRISRTVETEGDRIR